jgi:repressor LexA
MTPRQAECLKFITAFWEERNHAPSYEEIKEALGAKSKSSVASLIAKLEQRGHVKRIPNLARSIQPTAAPISQEVPKEDVPAEPPPEAAPWG